MWVFLVYPVNLGWQGEHNDPTLPARAGQSNVSASEAYERLDLCESLLKTVLQDLTFLHKSVICSFIIGHYGAFLQEEWDLLQRMSKYLERE